MEHKKTKNVKSQGYDLTAKIGKSIDWSEYDRKVQALEAEGLTRSDAQGVIDLEMGIL